LGGVGGSGGYSGYNVKATKGGNGTNGFYDQWPSAAGGTGGAGGVDTLGQGSEFVTSNGTGLHRIADYNDITIIKSDKTIDDSISNGAGGNGGKGGPGGIGAPWGTGGGGGGGGAGVTAGGSIRLIATERIIIESGAIIRCNAYTGGAGKKGQGGQFMNGGVGGAGGSSKPYSSGSNAGGGGGKGIVRGAPSGTSGSDGSQSGNAGGGGYSGKDGGGGSVVIICTTGPITIEELEKANPDPVIVNSTLQAKCVNHDSQFVDGVYQPIAGINDGSNAIKLRSGVIKLFHAGNRIYKTVSGGDATSGLTTTLNNFYNAAWVGENNKYMIGLLH
jgi:hypothetical protein